MKVEFRIGNSEVVKGEKGHTTYELPEKSIIHLPSKSSTTTKQHELYHAKYSPKLLERYFGKGTTTASAYATEEIRAEEFGRSHRAKADYMPTEVLSYIGSRLVDLGFTPNESLKGIEKALDIVGYEPLSRQEKSFVWQYIKQYNKEKKKEVS